VAQPIAGYDPRAAFAHPHRALSFCGAEWRFLGRFGRQSGQDRHGWQRLRRASTVNTQASCTGGFRKLLEFFDQTLCLFFSGPANAELPVEPDLAGVVRDNHAYIRGECREFGRNLALEPLG
jgi:hypothetical protein